MECGCYLQRTLFPKISWILENKETGRFQASFVLSFNEYKKAFFSQCLLLVSL